MGRCRLVVSGALLLACLTSTASAQPAPAQTDSAHSVTIQGEIVDPGLYLREARHGREAEELMYDAVEGGQSLALLQSGPEAKLILFLAPEPGDDPNELVYDFAGRQVKVTGRLYERSGVTGLVVENVESLEPDEAPAPAKP
ncbi:MAG: hypothetical protein HYZ92_06520 [Candidatus Omnitrophica bacterium]|nr:hypothetical protein [Candidatus Omnitrophota bacterium]